MLKKCLWVFLISMVPIIELRGAIPVGAVMELPFWLNYILCVFGNFLPVPFILLFIRKILNWMKTVKRLDKISLWVEEKAQKHSAKVMKGVALGLFLFVAIPLPGTGAWTGALIAITLGLELKKSFLPIALGVLGAGAIIVTLFYFAPEAFKMLVG